MAYGRPIAADPYPRAARRPWLRGFIHVAAAVRPAARVEQAEAGDGSVGQSEPGEVAEMEFGRLGLMDDPDTGRRRVVWALIIVLAYSQFVWPTFSQRLIDVNEGLETGWGFFGGVPRYLVIDNFPGAVAGPDPLHPRMTRGFLEYA